MKKKIFILCILIISSQSLISQVKLLTLEQAQQIARTQSDDMLIAKYDSLLFEYEYKESKTYILPQIKLSSKPYISQDITSVISPDGSEQYADRKLANYGLDLGITQFVPFTGGDLSITSSFNGLENFAPKKFRSFYFNWFNLSYKQNFGLYNEYKWNKKILESRKVMQNIQYVQKIEEINLNITDVFIELYMHQMYIELQEILLSIARLQYDNAVLLYESSKITREDLINAEIEYQQEQINYNNLLNENKSEETLKTLLKFSNDIKVEAQFNDSILLIHPPFFDKNIIIERVLYYDLDVKSLQQDIEYQKNIAKNDFNSGIIWGINLNAGLNRSSQQLPALFENPDTQYKIGISVSIPIADWGAANLRKKRLNLERELFSINNNKKTKDYEIKISSEMDEILFLFKSLKNNKKLLSLQIERMNILEEKLKVERIGKIDLIRAKSNLINNFIDYNSKLKRYMFLIYKYRYLSLWDLLENKPLFIFD